jgi:rhomboid protease GluP
MKRFWLNLDATTVIIAINTALFLLANLLVLLFRGQLPVLIALGADYSPLMADGQIWRWLTAGFLHIDPVHFILNMYALWVLGRFVERFYSRQKFIVVLLLGIIAGNLLSFLVDLAMISANPSFQPTFSLGASGGVFALLGLLLGTSLRSRFGPELPIDRNQLFLIAGYNLLLGFVFPGINNAAHIGGLLAGLALSLLIRPYYIYNYKRWPQRLLKFFTFLIAFACFSAIILQLLTAIFFFS